MNTSNKKANDRSGVGHERALLISKTVKAFVRSIIVFAYLITYLVYENVGQQ
jgi:hypothetical protein